MNEICVSGDRDDGKVGLSESVPNFIRLLFCERLLCRVEILERDVQLDTIEAGRFDAADHLRHRVGIIPGKNANANHNVSSLCVNN